MWKNCPLRRESRADMEKDNLFTEASFEQKLFYPKKCVNCKKSEFATKQRKMYFAKIILPHIYRCNNYENDKKFFSFLRSGNNLPN